MRSSGRPKVVLSDTEKARLIVDLERTLGLVVGVEETLTVAAWRSGTNPSEWTEAQLDGIRDGATRLLEQVRRTSIDGD